MNLGIAIAIMYGILTIIGGVIGYVQAGSKISFFSGSLCGTLLITAAMLQSTGIIEIAWIVPAITAMLVIIFSFRLIKTRKLFPAGFMTIFGAFSLVLLLAT